jgi:cyclophilin family peptidyl-prolyl cis-trans isomerase
MKRISVVLFFTLAVMASCKSTKYDNLDDGMYADLQTDKGDVLLKLEYELVPVTVANFVSLAEGTNTYVDESYAQKRFYDGLTFHRVAEDFVIQGGDPRGNGTGDPGYKFEDEFPIDDDGYLKLIHDSPGILSMANSGPDANGCQFFITLKEAKFLDGKHTVFGYVVQGMDVVDSIQKDDVINRVDIIRVGKDAKNFDAAKEFESYFAKIEEEKRVAEEKKDKQKAQLLSFIEANEANAKVMPSGLKIIDIKKGTGTKPKIGSKVMVNYAGYFSTGDLFDSNIKEIAETYGKFDRRRDQAGGYNPIPMDYSPDAMLIPGFREGLQQMNYGDKKLLLIPSHLGYGEQGSRGVIPPNADLLFEIEIVEE